MKKTLGFIFIIMPLLSIRQTAFQKHLFEAGLYRELLTSYSLTEKPEIELIDLTFKASLKVENISFAKDILKKNKEFDLLGERRAYLSLLEGEDTVFYNQILEKRIQRTRDSLHLQLAYLITKQWDKAHLYETKNQYQSLLKDVVFKERVYDRKKAWKAGALSACVPGLGKAYAGQPKQFLNTFLFFLFPTVQAIEGYLVGGIKDPRFIVFGSASALIYGSSVYGSVMSIKINKRDLHDQTLQTVELVFRSSISDLL